MLSLDKMQQIKQNVLKLKSMIAIRIIEETKVIEKSKNDGSDSSVTTKKESNNDKNTNSNKYDYYFNTYEQAEAYSITLAKQGKLSTIVTLGPNSYGLKITNK